MKLFWKLFFATMLISSVCTAAGGCCIININFHSQRKREIKTARDYNEVVCHALLSELDHVQMSASSDTMQKTADRTVLQIVHSTNISVMNQNIPFSVINEKQEVLFSSLLVPSDKEWLSSLSAEKAGWQICEINGHLYIQVIRPILYSGSVFYIETLRDISSVYQNREMQYRILLAVMAVMVLIAGCLTFLTVRLLLRQVAHLTGTTKAIAAGDLRRRAIPRGQDEIALLAENFNRMADSLEGKMHELENEAEQKERFVGAFSHELKTPLTSIIGYSDLLRRRDMNAEQRHICAEYIFSEGKHLEKLSMRLLDLIVLQNSTLDKKSTSVRGLISNVISMMKPQLSASQTTVVCHVEDANIPMEAELMQTVFSNLLDNATKAMDSGGTIEITGVGQAETYTLTIRDSGKGMKKEELDKIMQAFYMVDKSRSRKQGGAGLGLTISGEILKLHGFDLFFDSEVNKGTTVTVVLRPVERRQN